MALKKAYFFVSFLLQIQLSYLEQNGIERNVLAGTASGIFHIYSHHYLQVPIRRSLLVYDDTECSRECLREINCFSFNVAVNSEQQKNLRLCELLATTNFYAQEKLTPRSAFHHYSTIRIIPARSCFDHLKKGATKTGLYAIQDNPLADRENRKVFCDLTSEPGKAWTLVLSWELSNSNLHQFNTDHFSTDSPTKDQTPNWFSYRLPLNVMMSLKNQSSLWRATCDFPSIKQNTTLYRDYLRGYFRDFDIFNFVGGGKCKKVDYINIRGRVGVSTDAQFWQQNGVWGLHVDSSATGCSFKPNKESVPSENNFGFYGESLASRNIKFRCTASDKATTNWWFGNQ